MPRHIPCPAARTLLQAARIMLCGGLALVLAGGAALASPAAPARPDLIVADFEGATYGAGWTTTGTAFGPGPAPGALPRQQTVLGFAGRHLVNSFLGGDAATGTLTSPPFTVQRRYLRFLIGGGGTVAQESLELLVNDRVVRRATGTDSESLDAAQWDVATLQGQRAVLRVVDRGTGGWGHILVDDVVQTDRPPAPLGDPIARAMAGVRRAIPQASADPGRPVFHFHAPAQWMNDPNGFIFYGGWYHMFYQFDPYSSSWGSIHWGHARSRDLVNWQQLPVALWPSSDRGEAHVFSGSLFRDAAGQPRAFYTSIAAPAAPRDPEIWSARPLTGTLIRWQKLPQEPVLSEKDHGAVHIDEWRDPFLVTDRGVTYLLTGGEIGGRGVVCLYQARNGALTDWQYRGTLFQYPDPALKNIECPNFVRVGDRWALLISVNGQVEYFTGAADLARCRFAPTAHGILEQGSYASQATDDGRGQPVEFAWVRPIGGLGWSGCLTLPNLLSITPSGTLVATPAASLASLRRATTSLINVPLTGTRTVADRDIGTTLELTAAIQPGTATEIGLRLPALTDGKKAVTVRYSVRTQVLSVPGLKDITVPLDPGTGALDLHLYLDRSLLDIYGAGGRVVETGAAMPEAVPDASSIQVYAVGGTAHIQRLTLYRLKPAVNDLSRFH